MVIAACADTISDLNADSVEFVSVVIAVCAEVIASVMDFKLYVFNDGVVPKLLAK